MDRALRVTVHRSVLADDKAMASSNGPGHDFTVKACKTVDCGAVVVATLPADPELDGDPRAGESEATVRLG